MARKIWYVVKDTQYARLERLPGTHRKEEVAKARAERLQRIARQKEGLGTIYWHDFYWSTDITKGK